MTINFIKRKLSTAVDIYYLFLFLFLLLILHYGNLAFIAIVDPKGAVYSPFLAKYFDYITWIRNLYLVVSNQFAHLLGINSQVSHPDRLTSGVGKSITIGYDCLAINFYCFWTAFVLSARNLKKISWRWWLAGIFGIWLINSIRITMVFIAVVKKWPYNKYMEHHTLFNLCAYALIGTLVYFFIKSTEKQQKTVFA